MEYTKNYNLKKPSEEDFYNVNDFNSNSEIVDTELKKLDLEFLKLKEFLQYMPIDGGNFLDGNDPLRPNFDGGFF